MSGWGSRVKRHVPACREPITIMNSSPAKGTLDCGAGRKFFTGKDTLEVRSVGEGGGGQADKDSDLFPGKQERGISWERKECDVTGPGIVWT